MRHVFVSFICITLILTLLCLAAQAAAQKETLVVGLEYDPGSLDPAICYNVGWIILLNLYERLVSFETEDFTAIVPQLAESWELSEDGRTWRFHLREGAIFASGNPVNAEAVVFSLRRLIKLAGPPSWIITQFGITEDSVTTIDEYTVQIVLDQQYAPDLFLSCLPMVCILDPEVVLAHEQNGDLGSAWLSDHSAGSGLYMIDTRQQGTQIVLRANPQCWGPKPTFEQVIMKYVEEPAEQADLLQAGELDVARHLLEENVQTLENDPEIQIMKTWDFLLIYLAMNLSYPPFTSPEVRDAVRYAFDYEGIVSYVIGSAAVKHQNIFPKGLLDYTPPTLYTRNVEKAKHLFAKGGYPDGFEVDLVCIDFSPYLELAMKLKEDLAEAGITVNLIPMGVTQFEEAHIGRNFQMLLSGWYPDYADPDANARAFAHSDSIGDDATIKGPAWWSNYVNLETSKLVEQAAREMDPEKRNALYKRINDMIIDDGPFVFFYTAVRYFAVRVEVAPFIGSAANADIFPVLK